MAAVPREGADSHTPYRSTDVSTESRDIISQNILPLNVSKNILPLEHDVYAPPMSEVVLGTIAHADPAIVDNSDVGGAPSSSGSINYANRASVATSSRETRQLPREHGTLLTSGTDLSHMLLQNQIMVQQQAAEMQKMRDMIQNLHQTPLRATAASGTAEESSEGEVDDDDSRQQGFDVELHTLLCESSDNQTEDKCESEDGMDCLEMFFAGDKHTGPDLSSKLAGIVNNSVGVKVSEQKRKEIANKHSRPNNCKLQVPKVNKGVWKTLKKSAKETDVKWQTTQQMICTGMYPLLKLTDLLYSANKDQGVLLKKDLVTALTLANDSFISLQVAFTDMSLKRRFLLKPELNREFKELCNTDNAITDLLFGDDLDLQVKKLEEEAKVGKKMGKSKKQTYTGDRTVPYQPRQPAHGHSNYAGHHYRRGNYPQHCHRQSAYHQGQSHSQSFPSSGSRGKQQPFLGKTRPRGKAPR